jgi:acyl carrier protein
MLAVSEAVSLQDALALVAKRAQLMHSLCQRSASGMTACNAPSSRIHTLLASDTDRYAGLALACKNSTEDCVVAGPIDSLLRLESDNKSMGIKVKRLDVPYGFHSSALDPILEEFREIAAPITSYAPRFAVASSTLGKILHKDDLHAGNFVRHARDTVDFVKAVEVVESYASSKDLVFLEVGPAPKSKYHPHHQISSADVLSALPMVKVTLGNRATSLVPSLRQSEEAWVTMNAALSTFYLRGYSINWTEVHSGSDARFLEGLSHYPLSTSTFVVPYKEPKAQASEQEHVLAETVASSYSFLRGSYERHDNGAATYHASISDLATYIKSHSVCGAALCPASVYMELVAEAADLHQQSTFETYMVFNDVSFDKPLLYVEGRETQVLTSINSLTQRFEVTSNMGEVHCTGVLETAQLERISNDFLRQRSLIRRQIESVIYQDKLSSRMIYDVLFPRVVSYSGPFLTIRHLNIASSGLEAYGKFQLRLPNQGHFICHPAVVDTLLHAAGFVANSKVGSEEACICTQVEEAIIPHGNSFPYQEEMTVYCSLIDGVKGYIIADAYALDADHTVRAAVRGMHFKILRLKSFHAHLAKITMQSHSHLADISTSERTLDGHPRRVDLATPSEVASKPALLHEISPPVSDAFAKSSTVDHYSSLQAVIQELCGIDVPIDQHTSLEAVGVDSLLFIELTQKLERLYPSLADASGVLESCTTVKDIHELILSNTADTFRKPSDLKLMQQPSEEATGSHTPPTPSSLLESTVDDLDKLLTTIIGVSIAKLDKDTALESLGVDSLLIIELEQELSRTFDIKLDRNGSDLPNMTIQQLVKLVSDASTRSNDAPPCDARLVPDEKQIMKQPTSFTFAADDNLRVQESTAENAAKDGCVTLLQLHQNSATSLYLFHDGSGTSNVYARLPQMPCTLYGVSSVDFGGIDGRIQTLEQLAVACISRTKLMEADDFILGGKLEISKLEQRL